MNDDHRVGNTANAGHAAHGADNAPDAVQARTVERVDLPIEGMTCASCANRIEQRLSKQPGVASANVNFATRVATVKFDPVATGPAKLAQAVEDIGYKASVPAPALATRESSNPPYGDAGHDPSASESTATTRRCPYVVTGLRRAGFANGWL